MIELIEGLTRRVAELEKRLSRQETLEQPISIQVMLIDAEQTVSGQKNFAGGAVFGGAEQGGYVPAAHIVQIVASGTVTPLTLIGGGACFQFWKNTGPSAAIAAGMSVPGNAATDDFIVALFNGSSWNERFRVLQGGGVEMEEVTAPAAPATNKARLFVRDNGSGKTQLVVRFPTGAIQVIATEP
jgi:hypothetical protein